MNLVDLAVMSPLIILALTAVVIMLVVAVGRSHVVVFLLTLAGMAAAVATLPWAASAAPHRLTPLLMLDRFAVLYIGLLIAAGGMCVLLAFGYLRQYEGNREEFYLLALLATLGSSVLAASNHFASFFLGLELLSVSLYGLIAYPRRTDRQIEAGVKYLILAAVSSAFLLFGMALIYAGSGNMAIDLIGPTVRAIYLHGGDPWLLAGLGMMVTAIGFKLAVAPFHLWTPDVYQGAPAPVTAFVATVSKGSVVAILLRILPPGSFPADSSIFIAFAVIAVATMFAGNLLALRQENVKRILAYSSIAHLGYLLVAFLAGWPQAITAVTFYLIAYFVTTLGAFGAVAVLSGPEKEAESLDDYRGLFWRRPWLAGFLTAMVLSLAGLPMTAGFVGKFYLVVAGVSGSLWTLVIVLVFSSTIGLYYYLRILVALYAQDQGGRPATSTSQPDLPLSSFLTLATLLLLLLWMGMVPGPMIDLIQSMTQ